MHVPSMGTKSSVGGTLREKGGGGVEGQTKEAEKGIVYHTYITCSNLAPPPFHTHAHPHTQTYTCTTIYAHAQAHTRFYSSPRNF